ncbi:MAG: hypothetical protein K1000chlam2_01544 [Chlamydiae bacterium]|nr:hypothetical protein [Chlamydiota bacterium]
MCISADFNSASPSLGSPEHSDDGSSVADDFEITDCDVIEHEHWEEACDSFRSVGVLGHNAIIEYAKTLQKPFNLADKFITAKINSKDEAKEYLEEQKRMAKEAHKLLFVPLILLKGSLNTADHNVMLVFDPQLDSFEYYDAQGKDISKEGRVIKGASCSPRDLIEGTVSSNRAKHQSAFDGVNCGAFVCRFMRERLEKPFSEISTKQSIDIKKEREVMAQEIEKAHGIEQVQPVKGQSGFVHLLLRVFEYFLFIFLGKPRASIRYKLDGKVTYQFSELMQRSGRHYRKFTVEKDGKQYARLAYLSNSQRIWRVAVVQLSVAKGVAEDDMALPIDVNVYLNSLPIPKQVAELTTEERNRILPRGISKEALEYVTKFEEAGIPLLDESKKTEALRISPPYSCWKPREMVIKDPKNKPAFDQAKIVGPNMRAIPSINGKYRYLFIEEGKKVFLAMVEAVNEEITEYGNRAKYVDVGNMTMPLNEYPQQIPLEYADASAYVKEIPLIQKYCQYFFA